MKWNLKYIHFISLSGWLLASVHLLDLTGPCQWVSSVLPHVSLLPLLSFINLLNEYSWSSRHELGRQGPRQHINKRVGYI